MEIYEQLWREAGHAFERGEPQIDPRLRDKTADRRRGVSLAFWLPAAVRTAIKSFLDELEADFPGQYFYRPEELHVTVLTLISGSEMWRREIRDLRAFRDLLREILPPQPAFQVEFRGVTAAPNAVLVQGFPCDGGLETIRACVRRGFARNGWPDRLDRRYPNRAAHLTAMRFRHPDSDWKRLAAMLAGHRRTYFGEFKVEALKLVWGDWYASVGIIRTIEEFRLRETTPTSP